MSEKTESISGLMPQVTPSTNEMFRVDCPECGKSVVSNIEPFKKSKKKRVEIFCMGCKSGFKIAKSSVIPPKPKNNA